jgi:peptidoglycan hydrolase CwlO-like protein
MTLIEQMNQRLADLKVTADELPAKTKRKLASLKKILDNKLPTLRDKETGKFIPRIREQIEDLLDDINDEATAFALERDEELEKQKKAAEEAEFQRQQANNPPKPAQQKKKEEPAKKGGILDWLFE